MTRGGRCYAATAAAAVFTTSQEGWIISHQVKELVFMCTGNALIMDFALFNVGGGSVPAGGKSDRSAGKGWAPCVTPGPFSDVRTTVPQFLTKAGRVRSS